MLICILLSQKSERDHSVVHTLICLNKIFVHLKVTFDGLYQPDKVGDREQKLTKGKVRNLASSLITILFSSTILYYFANSDCL